MSNKIKLSYTYKFFGNLIVEQDLFGQPIQLNFKSKTKMKTCVGAILSILIKVVVFGFFIIKGIKLVGDEDRTIEQQIAVLSESELNQKLDFGSD